MRFILGLIIGATATLLLAPRLTELGFELPGTSGPVPKPSMHDVLQAVARVAPEPATETTTAPAPAPLEREPLPLPELVSTPAHDTTPVEVPADAQPAPMLTEISQEQTVWVPFRSEASARGFAAKLTERLERPFQVLRAGPGQYLVVFGYQSEPERTAVLDQIKAITGYVQL